ncbi:hypothetical protein CTAYLR_000591 [Chrysophaeum taylorii]|uniref:NAD-dependent epimerase/dehydratase domain-containing protein n=1 Tax=Chrysophaeum taylorii TaxID=2483200 RepID=A0AAD7XK99_9STRA|nr:hypothetical protein CTAYLR_000591 [Chrysophaeum taylorii]
MSVFVFGGNGFVGSAIIRKLVESGVPCVGVSRRASDIAPWHVADAMDPSTYPDMSGARAVVVSMGTPPLPFVDYETQRAANGASNVRVLEAAQALGVRTVLVNATMPRWAPSGYRDGKLDAEKAATGVVLKPSAIYGTRYHNGIPIPLHFLAPVSWVFRLPIAGKLCELAPGLFEGALVPPVPVSKVAKAAFDACVTDDFRPAVLGPHDILSVLP